MKWFSRIDRISLFYSFFFILIPGGTQSMADINIHNQVKGNTNVALDVFKKIKNGRENIFFSPYSLSSALVMTYGGARNMTAEQMVQTLHLNKNDTTIHHSFYYIDSLLHSIGENDKIQLSIANSLWPRKKIRLRRNYTDLLKRYYGIGITYLDYKNELENSRKKINQWVETQTMNKITNLIKHGDISQLTRLVLVNAIYFKGDWTYKFNKDMTQTLPFYITPDSSIDIPTMVQTEELGYAEFGTHTVLEIPYTGNTLSMIIILPHINHSLDQIEREVTVEKISEWTEYIGKKKIQIFMPKFTIIHSYDLSKILISLGMKDAFLPNQADFSGMDGKKRNLFIGAVIHKAFIEVNEEGSEAAAATAVVMRSASISEPPATVRVDRPFLFFIRDSQTKSILFLGRVYNPNTNN